MHQSTPSTTTARGNSRTEQLRDMLACHLEAFLLELGNAFASSGRSRPMHVDNGPQWVDLLLYHRTSRSLVVVDLKLDDPADEDVAQVYEQCRYAVDHWSFAGDNPPSGLVVRSTAEGTDVRYALDMLPNQAVATAYESILPAARTLSAEVGRARRVLTGRRTEGVN